MCVCIVDILCVRVRVHEFLCDACACVNTHVLWLRVRVHTHTHTRTRTHTHTPTIKKQKTMCVRDLSLCIMCLWLCCVFCVRVHV